jgi:hypothetical protein
MQGVSPEDKEAIKHINYVSNEIHDFADTLYESLMDREYDEAKDQAQDLIKVLAELIQSLSDEI